MKKSYLSIVPVYALIMAGILTLGAQLGSSAEQADDWENETSLNFAKRTPAPTVRPGNMRHFEENDKAPVIQWIENTRKVGKITSKDIAIVAQKNANESLFIGELTEFLKTQGYAVRLADSVSNEDKRNLSFQAGENAVMIHVGLLR